MQPKVKERIRAIQLRKQGHSYAEIQALVPVSQASLSLWLSGIALDAKQQQRLVKLSLIGQVAGAKARREKRLRQLAILEKEVERELPSLLDDPFFTFGLALYQAEGTKQKPWSLSQSVQFANSDPRLILAIRQWFGKYCHVEDGRFGYRLHIHVAADIEKAKAKWAEILDIDPGRITVTLKRNIVRSRHKHDNYIGLVSLRVYKSTWLNRRIELWGKGVAQKYLE